MLDLSNIKALVLDADGTIFGIKESIGAVYSECCKTHGIEIPAKDIDSIVPKIWDRFRSVYRNEEQGFKSSAEREREVWHDFCFALIEPFHTPENFQPVFETIYNAFASADYRTLFPGTKTLLKYAKTRELVTGLLSNNDERVRTLAYDFNLGELFDHIFPSAELGYKKPAQKCFELVAQKLNLEPADILYVGNNFELDYLASLSAGWKAVWFNPRSHERTDTDTYEVNSIPALKAALERGYLQQTAVKSL